MAVVPLPRSSKSNGDILKKDCAGNGTKDDKKKVTDPLADKFIVSYRWKTAMHKR